MKRDTSNDVAMTKSGLAKWMKKHDYNTQELADMLGVTTQAVTYWLTGMREIPEPIGRMLNFFDNYPKMKANF